MCFVCYDEVDMLAEEQVVLLVARWLEVSILLSGVVNSNYSRALL